MSTSPDIIERVKELQELKCQCTEEWKCDNCVRKLNNFPDIAQALLDREEKLKIAVEALESYANMDAIITESNWSFDPAEDAKEALSKIHAPH